MDAPQVLSEQERVERTNLHTLAVDRWMSAHHGFRKGIPLCAGRLVARVNIDHADNVEDVASELGELLKGVFKGLLPVSDEPVFNELLRLSVVEVDWMWIVRPHVQKAWKKRFGDQPRSAVKTAEEGATHG